MRKGETLKSSDGLHTDKGLIADLADKITDNCFFAKDSGGRLFVYREGVYRPNGESFVFSEVKKLMTSKGVLRKWSSHKTQEVARFITVDVPLLWEVPPMHILNLKNGLFDLPTQELSSHSPKHLSPIQLPILYDPQATCLEWDKFIKDVFPEDAQSLAYEIIAYLMRPDNSQQKAILLVGEGENGKSTFLRATSQFLGKENICAVSLHRLEEDKFSTQRPHRQIGLYCSGPADRTLIWVFCV